MANITNPNVVNLKTRLEDLSGTLYPTDDSAVGQWLLDGCYDVIEKIASKPGEIDLFTVKSGSYSSAMAITLDEIIDIIKVERGGVPCRRIDSGMREKISNSASMYYIDPSDDNDPIFYIHDGSLVVKPDPSGGKQGFYYNIPDYVITNWDTGGTTTIANFPKKYYNHICYYAAIKIVNRKMLDYWNELPDSIYIPGLPEMPDKPGNPPALFMQSYDVPDIPEFSFPGLSLDLGNIVPGARYYLEDEEDIELLGGAMQILEKEVTIFDKEMDKAVKEYERQKEKWDKDVQAVIDNSKSEDDFLNKQIQDYNNELTLYTHNLTAFNAEISKFTNEISGLEKIFNQDFQKIKQKYDWAQGYKMQLEKSYMELFGFKPSAPQQGGQ